MNEATAAPGEGSTGSPWELEFFGPARWPAARLALEGGFLQPRRTWWQRGFERLCQVPPNDDPAQPIGVLMHGPQGVAGISMLFASRRPQRQAEPWQVNASSWTVLPAARGRALWMARHTLSQPGTVYTALTPIDAATKLLHRIGFQSISDVHLRVQTARLAWCRPSGAKVLDATSTLAALRADPFSAVLQDHLRLGCHVCALETPSGLWPLVMRPRKRLGGLYASDVVYAGSTAALLEGLVPLSRHLLGHGHLLIDIDLPPDQATRLPARWPVQRRSRLRLARGGYDTQGIDHLYSELVYLQHR